MLCDKTLWTEKTDEYAFGRIRVCGRHYSADLILYPDRIERDGWRKIGHYLQVRDLAGLVGTPVTP